MTDAQRYDLDPDPRSRSRSQGPESCKITQIQSLSPSSKFDQSKGWW